MKEELGLNNSSCEKVSVVGLGKHLSRQAQYAKTTSMYDWGLSIGQVAEQDGRENG